MPPSQQVISGSPWSNFGIAGRGGGIISDLIFGGRGLKALFLTNFIILKILGGGGAYPAPWSQRIYLQCS